MPDSYSDQVIDWLVDEGYDTCFFLAGGNIMHLLNAARTRIRCIPVIHEVAAGIGTEYFNAARSSESGKAFALVTAGPGVTNIVTAMAGAYMESRELLVVAGQVKSTDLAGAELRQRGIQEVDACALAGPVTKATLQIDSPLPREEVMSVVRSASEGRHGPVLIDFCLDAQASAPIADSGRSESHGSERATSADEALMSQIAVVAESVQRSKRPIVLLGGGVSRALAREVVPSMEALGLPVATTWNALDRIDYASPVNFGRPDTWGMRWANILLQQADLIVAVGARLSLQQTGFNWQSFAPLAEIVHVDIDESELAKLHPRKDTRIYADAGVFLRALLPMLTSSEHWSAWRSLGRQVKTTLPLDDPGNVTGSGFLSPYVFVEALSDVLTSEDILIPCSSGGASTVLMQAFRQKAGQTVLNNKALASMGYGLSGAIGATLANPQRRVVLVEGDGGFAQNLQELGTVKAQKLNLKVFIYENKGYASIRMTQRNYFGGAYVGCDEDTGVGFPDWELLARSYGIPAVQLSPDRIFDDTRVTSLMDDPGSALFVVPLDPEQTYYPKITSRIESSGTMSSNPLHLMTPELPPAIAHQVMPYLTKGDA